MGYALIDIPAATVGGILTGMMGSLGLLLGLVGMMMTGMCGGLGAVTGAVDLMTGEAINVLNVCL